MKKEQKTTILIAILTAFITSFTGSALNLAIPDIGLEFTASASMTGWIITGYTITVAACSIPAGLAADKYGRKRVLVIGLVLFCGTSIASVMSASALMLIITRGLQGIGAAMIFSTNTAMLAAVFQENQRGRVMGYAMAATYVGLSAGPVLGGVINYNLEWRWIFALPVVVSLTALLMSLFGLRWKPSAAEHQLAAEVEEPSRGMQENSCHLRNETHAIKDRRGYFCSSGAALVNYGVTFALTYLVSVYLQVVAGYSSQTAGLIMLIQPVLIAVFSPLTGRLSDRLSPFTMAAWGMAVCTVAVIFWAEYNLLAGTGSLTGVAETVLPAGDGRVTGMVYSMLPAGDGSAIAVWPVFVVLAVTGIGASLFSSPNANAIMSCVDKRAYGMASSVMSTVRAAGNTLGMLAVTAISAIYIGDSQLKQAAPPQITKTITTVMIISAAVSIAAVFLAKIKKKKSADF